MTDLAWSMCRLSELLAFALYCPVGFCCGWDENLPFSWKLIFKICHALSKMSVDCLLLFNECMQCFLKIFSRRWSIRRCISMRILEIMMCLKRWLWSLCSLFQLKFGWFLQPGLYVCEYGLWLGLWKLFKSWACSWRHSLKEGKLDSHWLSVHWFHRFDTQCLEQILIDYSFSILVLRLF